MPWVWRNRAESVTPPRHTVTNGLRQMCEEYAADELETHGLILYVVTSPDSSQVDWTRSQDVEDYIFADDYGAAVISGFTHQGGASHRDQDFAWNTIHRSTQPLINGGVAQSVQTSRRIRERMTAGQVPPPRFTASNTSSTAFLQYDPEADPMAVNVPPDLTAAARGRNPWWGDDR